MASGGGGGGGWADACQASGERTSDRSLDMCANCGCRGIYEGICRDEDAVVQPLASVRSDGLAARTTDTYLQGIP